MFYSIPADFVFDAVLHVACWLGANFFVTFIVFYLYEDSFFFIIPALILLKSQVGGRLIRKNNTPMENLCIFIIFLRRQLREPRIYRLCIRSLLDRNLMCRAHIA